MGAPGVRESHALMLAMPGTLGSLGTNTWERLETYLAVMEIEMEMHLKCNWELSYMSVVLSIVRNMRHFHHSVSHYFRLPSHYAGQPAQVDLKRVQPTD